ncbi:MAG TPA: response regulator [Puia sp.]|jgi:two-component system response regulator|nr:response regulator [Puia sp.]
MEQREIEILLIEDNPDEAELTIRSLKKHNLANSLMHLDDGADALDFLFPQKPSAQSNFHFNPKLILLDLKLPKVTGLEILRRLKEDDRTKMIPVVVLTSSREEQDILESYKLGVNAYIVKPVNFESFTRAVSDLGLFWLLRNQPPPLIA